MGRKRSENLGLSPREIEVVQHIAAGLRNADIAKKLCIQECTVKNHISSIYAKLNMDRAQVVGYAYKNKLVRQVAFDLLKEAGVKVTALSTGKNAERLKPLAKYTCPFCSQVLEQDEKGLTCRCGYKYMENTLPIKEAGKEL